MRVLIFILALMVVPVSGMAQIKSVKNVEFSESSYVVTDSAVIVRYVQGDLVPYKIYDFSTRSVYVYFGEGQERAAVSHGFSDLADGDVDYMNKIGCDKAPLNNGFRRFCK